MFTVTADLVLPSAVTGSWPRPPWFDVSMWGRPLDTCMMDVRFREQFQDALAVVISEQERAGLDVLGHGDPAELVRFELPQPGGGDSSSGLHVIATIVEGRLVWGSPWRS
jgi:hypothetical protein